MNILHYSLGFPPYRTGGLTKFCIDLMTKQYELGHRVSLLWPGKMNLLNKKIKIIEKKVFNNKDALIFNYELINPLPVSYDEGVYNTKAFMKNASEKIYYDFLLSINPDVIHIHTFMGLHREFLTAAKILKIKLVFTTHDFFPMCPKVTLFRNNQICSSMLNCSECNLCNSSALSKEKIFLLQSPIYRYLKNSPVVKYLRRKHRNSYFTSQVDENKKEFIRESTENYKHLRDYYHSMLQLIDCIHYNSSVSKYVYNMVFDELPKGVICPIAHSGIKDKRQMKKFDDKEIKIRFLGQPSGAKGFFILKSALDRLYIESSKKFKLYMHYKPNTVADYMVIEESFTSENLPKIFKNTDVLIAPSMWYETFGFTVLEALSYGVPVIVSDTVGSKDILKENCGIVLEKINSTKLYKLFLNLRAEHLEKLNDNILKEQIIPTLDYVANKLEMNCYTKGAKYD